MPRIIRMSLATCLCFALGAISSGQCKESERLQRLDSVDVVGTRTLAQLSAEIDRLEDHFYERYNQLNTKREFDIHCGRIVRTGTKLSSRTCRASFEDQALQEEGSQAYNFAQYLQEQHAMKIPNPRLPGAPPIPAITRIQARTSDFRENLRQVVSQHMELQEILKRRAQKLKEHELARLSGRIQQAVP